MPGTRVLRVYLKQKQKHKTCKRPWCCLKTHVNATTIHVTLSTQPPSLTSNEATLTQNHSFCFLLAAATCPTILYRCLGSWVSACSPHVSPFPPLSVLQGLEDETGHTLEASTDVAGPDSLTSSLALGHRANSIPSPELQVLHYGSSLCARPILRAQDVYAQPDCCVHSFGDFQVPRPFEDSYQ